MNINSTTELLGRMADAVREARLEHGLTQAELAELTGVGKATVRRLERHEYVNPALVVRLGGAVVVLDAYRLPRLEHDLSIAFDRALREEVLV